MEEEKEEEDKVVCALLHSHKHCQRQEHGQSRLKRFPEMEKRLRKWEKDKKITNDSEDGFEHLSNAVPFFNHTKNPW